MEQTRSVNGVLTMSDDPEDLPDAESNIQEFLQVHGTEGLFVLYFRQFIYRFVFQELKSPSEDVEGASRILFSKPGGDEVEPNHEELLDQCEVWARELVDSLENDSVLRDIIENGDVERLQDEAVEDRVRNVMHQRFEEWADQSEELLKEVEGEL